MSRPFAKLKLGYYPLPVEEARNIRSLLISSSSYAAIDPCAGDGTALLEITKGTGADLAAIEIDADRAAAAAHRPAGVPGALLLQRALRPDRPHLRQVLFGLCPRSPRRLRQRTRCRGLPAQ